MIKKANFNKNNSCNNFCCTKIENFSVTIGNNEILKDVNLHIHCGELTSIIGPNGAGKSTLLRILAGIHYPDAGIISGLKEYSYGFMPDSIQIPSGVSGRHWLTYLSRLKGVSKEQVKDVLELTGLTEAADKDAASYSRGMLQRLLFAQMMLGDPDVLLMDEPGNGLDPFWVDEWKKWILKYREQGKTILFASHMLRDVVAVADRIILLHEGKMISDEPVHHWLKDSLEPEERFLRIIKKKDTSAELEKIIKEKVRQS